jgi:enoyl-CoA hydratase/carnithine racemase
VNAVVQTAPDLGGDLPRLHIGADGVAVITLARPAHLNRLHREDLLALQAHFETLRQQAALRALVLTGEGRAFCAGFHLGQLGASTAAPQAQGSGTDDDAEGGDPRLFEHTVDALAALPLPTVARLNGGVYGGATDLALACDFRIGVTGMSLRMPAAHLGLHYYASGLQRFVSRLGLGAAQRLFLLGETVTHTELLAMGYLDRCVPPEALDDAVQQITTALAAGAPLALRGMKQSLNEIAAGTADAAQIRAREAACAASADLREGLAAFAERRPARFEGR